MPWACVKCSYQTDSWEGEDCPDCGGFMEEKEPEIDWEGEGAEVEEKKRKEEYKKGDDSEK